MMDVWATKRLQSLLCLDDFETAARRYVALAAGILEVALIMWSPRATFVDKRLDGLPRQTRFLRNRFSPAALSIYPAAAPSRPAIH
jgi:hypothetical protein